MKSIIFSISLILSSLYSFGQFPNFVLQSQETMIAYLTENNVQFDKGDLVALKDISVFSNYNDSQKLTVPEAYFFNKDGYRVKGFDGTSCGSEITGLKKINKKSFIKDDKINDWVKNFTFFQNIDEDLLNSGYDFFVIINWATYLPKENQTSFNWYNALKQEKGYKIKIYLCNLDIQKDWELSQEQRDFLRIK